VFEINASPSFSQSANNREAALELGESVFSPQVLDSLF
jgi:hypothetical protein